MLLIKRGKLSNIEKSHIPFECSFIEFEGYNIAISDKQVSYVNNNENLFILLGNAIYDSTFIDSNMFTEICNKIETSFIDVARKLSGRFAIIYIKNGRLKVLSSLFGSFPIYYSGCGTYLSTIEPLISKLTNAEISRKCIDVMIRYYARYGESLYSGIKRIEYSSLTTISDKIEIKSYLSDVFSNSNFSSLEQDELISALDLRLTTLLNIYSNEKLRVGLTGGRDSRLILAMSKKIGIKNLQNYTVGKKGDIEAKYAARVSKFYGYQHEIFSPKPLNNESATNYFIKINNINFPCVYKWQLIEYLSSQPRKHINTATPETLLCHLDYFNGNKEPCINFLENRSSKIKNIILKNDNIINLAETGAKKIWENLENSLQSRVLKKLMFEQVTYQSEWVYNILKIGDYSGGTVCIFEDNIVLSILSNIKEEFFLDDKLYSFFVEKYYPEMNNIISTRDCDISRVLKLPKSNLEFWKLLPDAIKNDPLEYLISENLEFMRNVIVKNEEILVQFFGQEFISNCINSTKNGFIYNRIIRFILRRLGRKVLFNYEIIAPYCVANIINNRI